MAVPGQYAVQGNAPAEIPLFGDIINIILSQVTMAVITFCLTRRVQAVQSWRTLPPSSWLAVLIYCDSLLFVLLTAIVSKGLRINSSTAVCEGGIILCMCKGLACYVTTKVMMYLFLVEKAYLVRGTRIPRMKETQYRWNFIGIVLIFTTIIILNFVFRIAHIDSGGQCIIGMKKVAMIPLISFEVMVNVYLTVLFIIPLRKLYSYKHKTNTALRRMVLRSFVGSCTTLTSSVANLTVLMVLNGEPGWICLMLCNADVLFSVVILHWVTSFDSLRSGPARQYGGNDNWINFDGREGALDGSSSRTRNGDWRSTQRATEGYDMESVLGTRCSDRHVRSQRPQVTTEIRAGQEHNGGGVGLDTIDVQVRTEQRRDQVLSNIFDDARAQRLARTRMNRTMSARQNGTDGLEILEETEGVDYLIEREPQTACSEDSGKHTPWGERGEGSESRTHDRQTTRPMSPPIGHELGMSISKEESSGSDLSHGQSDDFGEHEVGYGHRDGSVDGKGLTALPVVSPRYSPRPVPLDGVISPSRSPVGRLDRTVRA